MNYCLYSSSNILQTDTDTKNEQSLVLFDTAIFGGGQQAAGETAVLGIGILALSPSHIKQYFYTALTHTSQGFWEMWLVSGTQAVGWKPGKTMGGKCEED